MREQTGFGTPLRRAAHQQAHSIGHYVGLHPEDVPSSTDDLYTRHALARREPLSDGDWEEPDTRLPSSTRRYGTTIQKATPKGIMRVTKHRGPPPVRPQGPPPIQPRASRYKTQTKEPETRPSVKRRKPPGQVHPLVYIGLCLGIMLFGWILLGIVANWLQVEHDNLQYGYPRTTQAEQDVGHGGVSHFIVVNLRGHIFITEVVSDHPEKSRLYTGPVLSGTGSDLAVATVSFQDPHNNGSLDMVLTVANTTYAYPNGPNGFQVSSNG